MRRLTAFAVAAALSCPVPASAAPTPPEDRTVFWHTEKAWALGTVSLGKPLTFREGKLLVFPAQVTDLAWAPKETRPRNMMLVHEVFADDGGKPFLKQGDAFFAPIRLLPETSYWKDNLPNTPRHEVAGGRRNVFRGKEAEEARRVLEAFMRAHEVQGLERWKRMLAAVAGGLETSSSVLREDAARHLSRYQSLARDFPPEALAPVSAFLGGDAPVGQKAPLIDALATAGVPGVRPALERLSSRADATGAAALHGLELAGETFETSRLLGLSRSTSPEVRAWAARLLGSRGATDEAARARAVELLAAQGEDEPVRSAAAQGLATAGLAEVLVAAVRRGDTGSRPAAMAIADKNLVAAATPLVEVLRQGDGEAAYSAVAALGRLSPCKECAVALREQHEAHRDEAVRDLIGVVLGVPVQHKH